MSQTLAPIVPSTLSPTLCNESSSSCPPAIFVDECFFNDYERPNHLVFVGIGLALTSAIMTNIGLIIQKQALNRERDRLDSSRSVKFYMVRRWWLGFLIFFLAQLVTGVSIRFASLFVLSPLGAFSLIVNVVTSRVILGEKSGLVELATSCIIVIGCAISTTMAPTDDYKDTFGCFKQYIEHDSFTVFSIIMVSIMAVMFAISRIVVYRVRIAEEARTRLKRDGDSSTKAMQFEFENWPNYALACRWMYPLLSGMMQCWTLNLGAATFKTWVAAIIGAEEDCGGIDASRTDCGKPQTEYLTHPQVYILSTVYLLACVMWTNLLASAMLVLDARFVIPIDFVCMTLLSLPLRGALHNSFQRWVASSSEQVKLLAYCGGVVITAIGVTILSIWGQKGKPEGPHSVPGAHALSRVTIKPIHGSEDQTEILAGTIESDPNLAGHEPPKEPNMG